MIRKQESISSPLVALNIGSDGIRAIAADWDERHNTLVILGGEYSNKHQSIDKGIPTQPSDVGFMIHDVIAKLSNRVGRGELKNIFVTIGGRSMQAVPVDAHRIQRRTEIKPKLLEEMRQECSTKLETHNPACRVLAVLCDQWEVDGTTYEDIPQGTIGKDIHLYATAFVMRKEFGEKITASISRAAIPVYHTEVTADADITALTTDEERERGFAIINMGAQTTTLTIYHHGAIQLTKVVPLGGYHITNDISALGLSIPVAEKLKRQFGSLHLKAKDVGVQVRVPAMREGEEAQLIELGSLSTIIAYRMDEIMLPLFQEIEKHHDDITIIYITGGASLLKGVVPYLSKRTDLPLDYGTHAQWLAYNTEENYYRPSYSTLVGTLLLGQTYLTEHPNETSRPPKGVGEKLKDFTRSLFGAEDE